MARGNRPYLSRDPPNILSPVTGAPKRSAEELGGACVNTRLLSVSGEFSGRATALLRASARGFEQEKERARLAQYGGGKLGCIGRALGAALSDGARLFAAGSCRIRNVAVAALPDRPSGFCQHVLRGVAGRQGSRMAAVPWLAARAAARADVSRRMSAA